jgi:signal transduction histidine kinase
MAAQSAKIKRPGKTGGASKLTPRAAGQKKPVIENRSKEQQLFQQLLSNYPDGTVSIIDRDYKFVITGGELHKILAAKPDELIGKELYPKFPQKLRNIIKGQLKKVFNGETVNDFELPYPLNGELYVLNAFPLSEKNGSVLYAGVVIRNISDLKIAKEEVKRTARKAVELVELKSRFITMASHEFRTPLSTVLTSASLLKQYAGSGHQENFEKHINRIVSSAHLLNELLNDFLTVEEIEQGKVEVNPDKFSIREFVQMCIGQLDENQKKAHEITYTHSGKEEVNLDPVLLKHIITNLISNAIKFSSENSPVEISTGWSGQRFVLTVQDHGVGIPIEYREHIFEKFYRASNALNIQGTGLGLHIVSKYVQLMNGHIKYESELQKGTRFIVSF